jgi:integrase
VARSSISAISDLEVKQLIKADKAFINCGNKLYLRKRANGYLWYYRTTSPETKLDVWHAIGKGSGYPTISLAKARELAKQIDAKGVLGVDVKEEIRREGEAVRALKDAKLKFESAKRPLRGVFEQWKAIDLIPRVRTDGTRTGRKDEGRYVEEQFDRHVFPLLGEKPIAEITKADIIAVLDAQKMNGKLSTANKLLSDLKQLFSFAYDREIIQANPIGSIKKSSAGGKSVLRKRTLDDSEIQDLRAKIPNARLSTRTAIGIWLLLSTGARVGELMGATWKSAKTSPKVLREQADAAGIKFGTVDLAARSWYLPDTKNQRDHSIHLSELACQQFLKLRDIAEHEAWIFPDSRGEKPVCVKSFGKQIADRQRLGRLPMRGRSQEVAALSLPGGKWTAHDLRRTAATIMARLGTSGDVINECLNHMQAGAMSRVYIQDRRGSQQAVAFDALGKYLEALLVGCDSGKVVSRRSTRGQIAL